jgi:adenylate kinase family enzyme
MERVLLLGCGGSGKSTLARELGRRLGLPVIHLDRLFWQSGWVNVTKEVFDARLAEALAAPRWVMDGNYDRTLPLRLARCDTAVYLDYSRFACLRGVLKRVLSSRGRTRPDMADGCPERVDAEFLRWIWTFRKKVRPGNLAMLEEAGKRGVAVVRVRSRRECRKWMQSTPIQPETRTI